MDSKWLALEVGACIIFGLIPLLVLEWSEVIAERRERQAAEAERAALWEWAHGSPSVPLAQFALPVVEGSEGVYGDWRDTF